MPENLKNIILEEVISKEILNEPIYNYNKIFNSFKGVIRDLEPDIFALRSILDLDEDTFHNLVIIITEGFNNAVKHGNNYNPEKEVNIKISVFNTNDIITYFNEDKNCYVNGNKNQLNRVFTNIIQNPIQAVSEKIKPQIQIHKNWDC